MAMDSCSATPTGIPVVVLQAHLLRSCTGVAAFYLQGAPIPAFDAG